MNQVRTRQEPAIPCQSFLKCAFAMTLLCFGILAYTWPYVVHVRLKKGACREAKGVMRWKQLGALRKFRMVVVRQTDSANAYLKTVYSSRYPHGRPIFHFQAAKHKKFVRSFPSPHSLWRRFDEHTLPRSRKNRTPPRHRLHKPVAHLARARDSRGRYPSQVRRTWTPVLTSGETHSCQISQSPPRI